MFLQPTKTAVVLILCALRVYYTVDIILRYNIRVSETQVRNTIVLQRKGKKNSLDRLRVKPNLPFYFA